MNRIKCVAVKVNTDSGICPGIAQTKQGETFIIGARTPASTGMCCQAFTSLAPMKLAFMLTKKMSWEENDYFDITCPHGKVTYRISRMSESEE
ncbi:MAG: hypothetical protein JW881_00985 [Spirochaetales bacterium]|nr:hypothetical protein [Spirochaetales bacterium]